MTPPKTSKLQALAEEEPNGAAKRQYNSPKRQQQSAKTRNSIVRAGAELVHEFKAWDWRQLTFRAVSERAGVSERTVYRYFPAEGKLKMAVMEHLVKEAGVELKAMKLSDFGEIVHKTYEYLSGFAIEPINSHDDPTFQTIDAHRRIQLIDAVAEQAPQWTDDQRETAAAALDIFWNLPPFERLTLAWGFDQQRSTQTVQWVIGLIEKAIAEGKAPK